MKQRPYIPNSIRCGAEYCTQHTVRLYKILKKLKTYYKA